MESTTLNTHQELAAKPKVAAPISRNGNASAMGQLTMFPYTSGIKSKTTPVIAPTSASESFPHRPSLFPAPFSTMPISQSTNLPANQRYH